MAASAVASLPAQTSAARLRRLGADALYLLLGFVMSIVAFTVWVTGVTLSLSLGLLIIGFPVVILTFACFRWLADLERWRAGLVLGERIPSAYRPAPPDGRIVSRLKVAAHDPQRWKDVVYLAVISVVGFVWGIVWLALWSYALGSLTLPAWWWALPSDAEYMWFTIDSWEKSVGIAAFGVVLLALALLLQRPLAVSQAQIARWLLAPSLAARVEQLTETRAGAVDAATAELQRIERDLHDGAQARLVALAMDLGMAEERFDRDPESARELVGEAREEAKRALAELRDLARGMRPSLLAERGLGPAIVALAARSPVPATATVDVPGKLPAAVETAAWFVVSEALANTAKHSGAARAAVWLTQRDGELHVEVVDDGSRRRRPLRHRPARARAAGRGARRLARGPQPARRADGRASGPAVRVVIAEDLALLRDGLERLLRDSGFDVVAAVADGDALLAAVEEHVPDVAIVDVRLPPAFRDEGVRAALELRRRRAGFPVLILSQYVEQTYAAELLADGTGGVGYLLKDRVSDVLDFVDAVRRVASRRHGARPRGRLPARRRPRGRPAHPAQHARARGARADGRGPHEPRDRRRARDHVERRREARREHLRQARPAAGRQRPPARARGRGLARRLAPAAGPAVTTIVCSTCAASAPSAVRTVQPSPPARMPVPPAPRIGSIVITRPECRRVGSSGSGTFGHRRRLVDRAPDPVAAELVEHRHAASGGLAGHRLADRAHRRARDRGGHPARERGVGRRHQPPHARRGGRDRDRHAGVRVEAVELGRDVELDEVAAA